LPEYSLDGLNDDRGCSFLTHGGYMKIEKKVLVGALKVLGKVSSPTLTKAMKRQVRFQGVDGTVIATMTGDSEVVALRLTAESEEDFDFSIQYMALREMVRTGGRVLDLQGETMTCPANAVVPSEAVEVDLPDNFTTLLRMATSVVDRFETRRVLQGINLSPEGITATDGKQLLHLPVAWSMKKKTTIPLPYALLMIHSKRPGKLYCWEDRFKIETGNFSWIGRSLGEYPNWRQVVPDHNSLDYQITLHETERVLEFLKTVPDFPPYHCIRIEITPNEVVIVPTDFPEMKFKTNADFIGTTPKTALMLNKDVLTRMLQQGYRIFRANSDGMMPVLAEGGLGKYVVMPIRLACPATVPVPCPNQSKHSVQEEPTMDEMNKKPEPEPVNAFDELNANVEDLRAKLKSLCEDSTVLVRKIKEAALQQKQKEREFVQAKRAIERIKMAI